MNDFAEGFPLLSLIVAVPVLGALVAAVLDRKAVGAARIVGFVASGLTLLLAVVMLLGFDRHSGDYQFVSKHQWIPAFGADWHLGVDGVSLFLVVLTGLIFVLAIAWPKVTENAKAYIAWVLLLEAGCLAAFLALDLFLFFVAFEAVLVPMYMLIVGWGGDNRAKAALKFFLYTLAGSAFLFVGMLALVMITAARTGTATSFDITQLANANVLTNTEAKWIFMGFAIAFAVKIPLFPLHTWLPLTYKESPVAGVVISSAVMVKLGTYGLIRFGIFLFPNAADSLAPLLLTLAVIAMIYGAIVAVVQKDMRRLLAYSSLSHLGFIVLGTFAFSSEGLSGAVLQMINHGITASALFLLLGMVYVRFGSDEIANLKGIQKLAPVLAALFTVAVMSSIGVPGLNGFVGEFLVLSGTFITHRWWAVVGTFTVVIAALYLLWAYQRSFHGEPTKPVGSVKDLSLGERLVVAPLIVLIVFLGVYPQPVLDRIEPSVNRILERTPAHVAGADRVVDAASDPIPSNTHAHEGEGH